MPKDITETVLKILNKSEDDIIRLKIEARLNEILAYLNRDEVTDSIFAVVCAVIAESLKNDDILGGNIQSYSEGDMSVSFSSLSPYFGRLEPFKVIKGIGKNV